MSNDTSIKIVMTEHGRGKVWLNGAEVSASSALVSIRAGETNEVTLKIMADQVEIEGPFEVAIAKV